MMLGDGRERERGREVAIIWQRGRGSKMLRIIKEIEETGMRRRQGITERKRERG